MHQGKTHLCVDFNLETQIALVQRLDLKYYTSVLSCVQVQVKGENHKAFDLLSADEMQRRKEQGSLARVAPATVRAQGGREDRREAGLGSG